MAFILLQDSGQCSSTHKAKSRESLRLCIWFLISSKCMLHGLSLVICLSAAVSDQHLACDSVLLFRGFKGGRDDCIAWTPSSPCDLVNAVLCMSHSVWTTLKLKLIVTSSQAQVLKR